MRTIFVRRQAPPPPRPICEHDARMMGFGRDSYGSQPNFARLQTAGGWGAQPPPRLQTHMMGLEKIHIVQKHKERRMGLAMCKHIQTDSYGLEASLHGSRIDQGIAGPRVRRTRGHRTRGPPHVFRQKKNVRAMVSLTQHLMFQTFPYRGFSRSHGLAGPVPEPAAFVPFSFATFLCASLLRRSTKGSVWGNSIQDNRRPKSVWHLNIS